MRVLIEFSRQRTMERQPMMLYVEPVEGTKYAAAVLQTHTDGTVEWEDFYQLIRDMNRTIHLLHADPDNPFVMPEDPTLQ
jgi:hypothetical protein